MRSLAAACQAFFQPQPGNLLYAKRIIEGISEVRDLIYVMLKGDDGRFLKQLTDLIFGQLPTNAMSFFDLRDSVKLRLYYKLQSAGMAAFIISESWTADCQRKMPLFFLQMCCCMFLRIFLRI